MEAQEFTVGRAKRRNTHVKRHDCIEREGRTRKLRQTRCNGSVGSTNVKVDLAASAAQGYSRRFRLRLKPRLRGWDFVMGLLPAAAVPLIQRGLFGTSGWASYVVSVLIAYAAFFVIYLATKAVLLLISRDKQLELAEVELAKVGAEQIAYLEKLSDEGNFWVFHYQQSHNLPIWQNGEARWSGFTGQALLRLYGKATEEAFNTFDGLDRQQAEGMDLRYLNRRLENLRRIIQSLSSSSASQS
jgi:hypothetical protein